jgi:hypothetical protein
MREMTMVINYFMAVIFRFVAVGAGLALSVLLLFVGAVFAMRLLWRRWFATPPTTDNRPNPHHKTPVEGDVIDVEAVEVSKQQNHSD